MLTELLLPTRPSNGASAPLPSRNRLLPLARVAPPAQLAPPPAQECAGDAPAASFSRVAEAHRVSAAALDTLVERLPVGVIVTDANGRFVYANSEARRLVVGECAPIARAVACALLTGQGVSEEAVERPTTTGPRRWLSIDVAPVRATGSSMPHAALLTVNETTAQRQAADWMPLIESLARL